MTICIKQIKCCMLICLGIFVMFELTLKHFIFVSQTSWAMEVKYIYTLLTLKYKVNLLNASISSMLSQNLRFWLAGCKPWYTGCSKVLRCFLVIFGLLMGWFPFQTQCAQFCKLDFGNFAKKAPNLFQIGCFLQQSGILLGREITLFEV